MTPAQIARAVFDGELPPVSIVGLQERLAAWQGRNFGAPTVEQVALGVCEEAGELAHATLKHSQRIRGMADEDAYREAAGDAIADTTIYLIQMATLLRFDFLSLVASTAAEVMQRDWKKAPETGR